MTNITVELTHELPSHAVYLSAPNAETVNITVSPQVEAVALSMLDRSLAEAVTEAVDESGLRTDDEGRQP